MILAYPAQEKVKCEVVDSGRRRLILWGFVKWYILGCMHKMGHWFGWVVREMVVKNIADY